MSSKSRQVSLDRLFSALYFRQEDRTRFQERIQVMRQVFQQNRVSKQDPVLMKNMSKDMFPVLNTVLSSCFEQGPEKSLFRETCLDLELRNKKNLSVSLFFVDRLTTERLGRISYRHERVCPNRLELTNVSYSAVICIYSPNFMGINWARLIWILASWVLFCGDFFLINWKILSSILNRRRYSARFRDFVAVASIFDDIGGELVRFRNFRNARNNCRRFRRRDALRTVDFDRLVVPRTALVRAQSRFAYLE